ncbi:MAG: Ldh family oxidoreductase [candidate division Zixibacteria bacterium]|nr:Ldh family oxidoreductase [candidate division Zixibacteria bacterium]
MAESVMLEPPFVIRVDAETLKTFCMEALTTVGMAVEHARITTECLVRTDMRGIYTHGTVSLRRYVQLMRDGGIDPRAVPEITNEGPAWAMIDAHQAVGMVAGHVGMTTAMKKAAGCGYSNHFGAASAYTLMVLDQGMIGMAMSNTDVVMSIPNGRGAQIGNNPLSYAVPARTQPPLVLDIAMSTVAGGKVVSMKNQGKPIPEGWLTDKDGLPTTDPGVFTVHGALTPLGGHKGYGLALMVESLAGVLAGAGITTDMPTWAKESRKACNEGHTFIAVDIAAMMPKNEFYTRMDELIRRMRTAPKAKNATRTYIPGEMEYESEAVARTHGVALTDTAVANLRGLAEDTGLGGRCPV